MTVRLLDQRFTKERRHYLSWDLADVEGWEIKVGEILVYEGSPCRVERMVEDETHMEMELVELPKKEAQAWHREQDRANGKNNPLKRKRRAFGA